MNMKKLTNAFLLAAISILMVSFFNCAKEETPDDSADPPDPPDTTDLFPCWSELAYLQQGRSAHMVVVMDNKIYVAGGITTNRSLHEYDFSTNSWRARSNMPTGGEWLSGCAFDGKIYVMGGWWDEKTFDVLEVYDPATDGWMSKSPMPTKRFGHAAVEVDGLIYVIGGARDWPVVEFYETIEIYDPQTDTWTTKNADITPRWGLSGCEANGRIYIMGGDQAEDYQASGESVPALDVVEEYDPVTGIWKQKSSMPTARWGLASVSVNNMVFAIGGADEYEAVKLLDIVEQYDPVADTWVTKSPMPRGRLALAGCELDNVIYVPGGGGLTQWIVYRDFFVYDPACDTVN